MAPEWGSTPLPHAATRCGYATISGACWWTARRRLWAAPWWTIRPRCRSLIPFFGDDTTSASAAIALKAVTLGPVPLPASAWLLILGLPGLRQRARRKPLHQGRPMA